MVVVGADVHKQTHTFVAVDEVGRQVGQLTVKATSEGHAKAWVWATREFGAGLVWAIEDCRHLSARLERDLLTVGQRVVRVPPKMMAEQRRVARTRGKSDPIDALAVARAFLREPELPVASHDEGSRQLKLLIDYRESLVSTRTRIINSLLWRIHELDPERAPAPRSLDRQVTQRALREWLVGLSGIVAELALAKFARHAGIAPIPVWSGNTAGRVRLTRSGNRQLNAALHRIAVTQIRLTDSLGKKYYDKKKAEGMSTPEALRCLKRRLARIVYDTLIADHQATLGTCIPAAA